VSKSQIFDSEQLERKKRRWPKKKKITKSRKDDSVYAGGFQQRKKNLTTGGGKTPAKGDVQFGFRGREVKKKGRRKKKKVEREKERNLATAFSAEEREGHARKRGSPLGSKKRRAGRKGIKGKKHPGMKKKPAPNHSIGDLTGEAKEGKAKLRGGSPNIL